jgi:hypothetical protein
LGSYLTGRPGVPEKFLEIVRIREYGSTEKRQLQSSGGIVNIAMTIKLGSRTVSGTPHESGTLRQQHLNDGGSSRERNSGGRAQGRTFDQAHRLNSDERQHKVEARRLCRIGTVRLSTETTDVWLKKDHFVVYTIQAFAEML